MRNHEHRDWPAKGSRDGVHTPQDVWRPMKDAPDDESCILASSGGYVGEAIKDFQIPRSDEFLWRWAGKSEPIHENLFPLLGWQPMPAPPLQPLT